MELPGHAQPLAPLLGGKQYQRAMQLFESVIIDQLPDPNDLRKHVSLATGYLNDGLQRENWEHAVLEIIKVSVKEAAPPCVNYCIKHVGVIFRRLFAIALADAKQGDATSEVFGSLPASLEEYISQRYDDMIWDLMLTASNAAHGGMEPMYSTVNPNLLAAVSLGEPLDKGSSSIPKAKDGDQSVEAKRHMKQETKNRHLSPFGFLREKRSAMITPDETDHVLQKSFAYIQALMEFNMKVLEFSFNHHLYEGFKQRLRVDLGYKLLENAPWDQLAAKTPDVEGRLKDLAEKTEALKMSLQQVAQLQKKVRH